MSPLLGNFLKEILSRSHDGPIAYNDRPWVSVWLTPNTLIWTPTTYYKTKKTLVGAQEIFVEWMSESVGLGWADLKETISGGKVNCLSKAISREEWVYSAFFFFVNVSKNCHFRESILWCKTVGGRSIFLALENDSYLRTLLRTMFWIFPEKLLSWEETVDGNGILLLPGKVW